MKKEPSNSKVDVRLARAIEKNRALTTTILDNSDYVAGVLCGPKTKEDARNLLKRIEVQATKDYGSKTHSKKSKKAK